MVFPGGDFCQSRPDKGAQSDESQCSSVMERRLWAGRGRKRSADLYHHLGLGVLNADASNIGQVTYDLRTDGFFIDGNKRAEVELNPGDSTFVSCVECVQLPNDLTASVLLRNSRIRQGLSLDATLYFPGHGTRLFYRVTNVSGDVISLDRSKGIAQVAFQHVDGTVANPYKGAFSDEIDFSGLADYSDIYAGELKRSRIRKKKLSISSRVSIATFWLSSQYLLRFSHW